MNAFPKKKKNISLSNKSISSFALTKSFRSDILFQWDWFAPWGRNSFTLREDWIKCEKFCILIFSRPRKAINFSTKQLFFRQYFHNYLIISNPINFVELFEWNNMPNFGTKQKENSGVESLKVEQTFFGFDN